MGTSSIKVITSEDLELSWGPVATSGGIVIRSDTTLDTSLVTIDDDGNITLPDGGILFGAATALKTATTIVDVSASAAPAAGDVLTATGDSAATWQTPSAGGNSGTATLDFGATMTDAASVVVTGQAWVTAGSEIHAYFMGASTADNNADDHEHAAHTCVLVVRDLVVGDGFTISAYARDDFAAGQFTVCWEGS